MISRYDKFVHNFNGKWYVCQYDSVTGMMTGTCFYKTDIKLAAHGYCEASATIVADGKVYKTREAALKYARRVYRVTPTVAHIETPESKRAFARLCETELKSKGTAITASTP